MDQALRSKNTNARRTRFCSNKPKFARSVGLAALRWLLSGYGYDLTAQDVVEALDHTLAAARHNGTEADTVHRIQQLIDQHPGAVHAFTAQLRRKLDESAKAFAP